MAESHSGLAYASIGTGVVLLWSSIQNNSITSTLRDLISGKTPKPGAKQSLISSDSSSAGVSPSSQTSTAHVNTTPDLKPGGENQAGYQAYAMSLLALHGWPTQWGSFNSLEMSEAGWSSTVANSSSGALGLAQALGHGTANTAGTLGNEYGGNGLSDSQARAANSGNGYYQLQWMMNYVRDRYGSPDAAWAFHLANNWY